MNLTRVRSSPPGGGAAALLVGLPGSRRAIPGRIVGGASAAGIACEAAIFQSP